MNSLNSIIVISKDVSDISLTDDPKVYMTQKFYFFLQKIWSVKN